MPKSVGRVGEDLVGAGILMTPLVPNVYVNGAPIAVVKTKATGHGPGPHAAPIMMVGSLNVFAGPAKLAVCGTGDVSTCGHPLKSTSNVFVN